MGKIGLIIEREFMQRVRKKSFLITTIIMPLAMVALMVVPALMARYGGDSKVREIVVLDGSGIVAPSIQNDKNLIFISDSIPYDAATAKYPNSYGFLEVGADIVENPSALKLYTRQASTMGIESVIRSQVSDIIRNERIAKVGIAGLDSLMQTLDARASIQTFEIGEKPSDQGEQGELKASSSAASMGVAYVTSFLTYFFILIYGMMVLQGVVEEKSSRIIEVIVSSVKPFELMMGKILGIALVALLQFVIWIIVGVGLMFVVAAMGGVDAAQSMAAGASGGAQGMLSGVMSTIMDPWFLIKMIGGFLIFFIGGYLLYASMFAAVGSAVDNVGDTQQLQIPITIPLIIAIVAMVSVMQNPYSSSAFWFSIIPFTSPIIMMARLAYGIPVWEFILSVVLLYGTFVAMTAFAAKIYRTGIFMYGKKPTLRELIKWARYKN